MHELVPDVPLRHGHAISIDMAYSATLANQRGLLSDAEHERLLGLFSRAGLSMDHPQFDEDILDKATKAILRTRDGKLRAAVPNPLGSCAFVNDVEQEELAAALRRHKEVMQRYPRRGEGLEAYVDASDTGYTMNDTPAEKQAGNADGHLAKAVIKDDVAKGMANGGLGTNGNVDGVTGGVHEARAHAGGAEDADGARDGLANGTASRVNGVANGAH